ncbi:MAG: alkaline phosphatase family protein [Planctomycetota bacterium]|nr:alkaline phosphatase family protein [Planctomycetota bacterium]
MFSFFSAPSALNRTAGGLRPWLLLAAGVFFVSGCAAMPDERRATFGIRFPPPAPSESPSAIVFVVDGVNRDVFAQMLDEGRLPNLRKYFADRGLFCERCVANVPGVTLPNETSIVTGLFAGRHGVMGIQWFDRNQLIERNYEEVAEKNLVDGDYRAATIFERLGDSTTMSLFHQAHRGATQFVENWMSAGPPFFFGWYGFVDRIALWRFDIVAQIARAQGGFPALVMAYLLAPDMEGYRSGVSSDAYRGALEHADAHIGRILRDLEAAGRLEGTVLAFVSDHGMVDVARHWPIKEFFRRELHLAVPGEAPWETTRFENRLAYFDKYECVLEGSGDRYWAIYLRKPRPAAPEKGAESEKGAVPFSPVGEKGTVPFSAPSDAAGNAKTGTAPVSAAAPKEEGGMPTPGRPGDPPLRGHDAVFENWLARPGPEDLRHYPTRDGNRINLVERLVAAEAVDLVAYRAAANKVHIVGKKGTMELERGPAAGGAVSCRIIQGDDPLDYSAAMPPSMLYGKPHTAQEWLEATADTEYPDLVPQIMAYFDAPRAGDIVVFAAPGWDFHNRNKAGHGGVRPGEMVTVMLLAGPGVPHERRTKAVRSVDLAPTLLDLLGRPVPADLDGRSLLRR